MHVYVCVAFLRSLRSELIRKTGDEILEFLTVGISGYARRNILIRDVEMWLSQAHVWRSNIVMTHTSESLPDVTQLYKFNSSIFRTVEAILWRDGENEIDSFLSVDGSSIFDSRV